ncbi:hypothetical protein M409DRAFT_29851 [Zasmidium cellare ATCC 36951]|uniref:Uncharacterized protein n=1 Tax=Zasmidium cellare ATCC 36951 TaxID=1080233 RepID=A0A6A6C1I8_ZASCE|nr:uncharacterized protein M409DRAFT_29851 [Zasmidium cellare ATCC 36951]KAF2159689.1 hypothetical protein M409DRAFT_29851 [Zasmidium cellare ATCC 36951]
MSASEDSQADRHYERLEETRRRAIKIENEINRALGQAKSREGLEEALTIALQFQSVLIELNRREAERCYQEVHVDKLIKLEAQKQLKRLQKEELVQGVERRKQLKKQEPRH